LTKELHANRDGILILEMHEKWQFGNPVKIGGKTLKEMMQYIIVEYNMCKKILT
jgi:hypothetical protein